ncbi:MAG TPA: hypothetical protein VJZ00_04665 [Thermoanaerobaculia bacterium]|nr:hypothetical protein [Thermoanaerobaculia bacterium]
MKSLIGQRSLLAMSLAASLAAAGCTTDRNVGNGSLNDWSGVRSAPTSGVTSGSETAPLPPPMTSSYSRTESQQTYTQASALPKVARSVRKLTPDEAALIMAQHRPRVQVLGTVSPALAGNAYYSAGLQTGQFQNPAMLTNPTPTINSSLTSGPGVGVTSGVNDGTVAATNVANSTLVTGTTGFTAAQSALATTQSTVAPVFAAGSPTGAAASTLTATSVAPTLATPTNAAMGVTPGQFAAGAPTFGVTNTGRAVGTAATNTTSTTRVVNSGSGITITNQKQQ